MDIFCIFFKLKNRESKPGAILPPRPFKYGDQLLKEDDGGLPEEFADKFARVLEVYISDLLEHALVGISSCPVLHTFLTFSEYLGEEWPECSAKTLTRITAKGLNFKATLSSKTAIIGKRMIDPDEGLVAITEVESKRISKVNNAVPKIEAMLPLMNDYGELSCELSTAISNLSCDETAKNHLDMVNSMEILSSGLMQNGLRMKKCSVDLQAGALHYFVDEMRHVTNEILAFEDRRRSLLEMNDKMELARIAKAKWLKKKSKGKVTPVEVLELNEEAVKAKIKAASVGAILKDEVERMVEKREKEWPDSLDCVAQSMQTCMQDNLQIWRCALEEFHKIFPPLQVKNETDNS